MGALAGVSVSIDAGDHTGHPRLKPPLGRSIGSGDRAGRPSSEILAHRHPIGADGIPNHLPVGIRRGINRKEDVEILLTINVKVESVFNLMNLEGSE